MNNAPSWMPLNFAQFLQDTAFLDAAETGAYMLLSAWYWANGPLPSSRRDLSRIAKLDFDTWSIALSNAWSMRFSKGADGRMHLNGSDRKRTEWLRKRKNAHEKAVKVARARWDRRDAEMVPKRASEHDASSIAPSSAPSMHAKEGASLEGFPPHPLSQLPNSQETGRGSTPSQTLPSGWGARARSSNGFCEDDPSMPEKRPSDGPGAGRGESLGESKDKAKPRNLTAGAIDERGVNGIPIESRENGRRVAKRPSTEGNFEWVGPQKVDPRFLDCQEEVFRFWRGQNPGDQECPWIRSDKKALLEFLKGFEGGLEEFRQLLVNRARSNDANPSSPPRIWLRDLIEYATGPHDRYRRQQRPTRVL